MTKRSNSDTLSEKIKDPALKVNVKCLDNSSTKNIERIPKQNNLFSFTNTWKDEVF